MRTKTDFYAERARSLKPYFDDYLTYARKIKRAFEKRLEEVEVYAFGSRLGKKYSPYHSDIDLLVISPNTPPTASDRASLKLAVSRELGFSEPFEIHLITPKEYTEWYRYLIREKKAI